MFILYTVLLITIIILYINLYVKTNLFILLCRIIMKKVVYAYFYFLINIGFYMFSLTLPLKMP